MDFSSFKPISGRTFSENQFKNGMKNAKDTQIYTQRGPSATGSGPLTPLVSETEREGTSDEQISPAVRFPATGWAPSCSPQRGAPSGTLGLAEGWPEHLRRACMAVRRRCSPWPGCSGVVEHAQGLLRAFPSYYGSNAPKSKRKGAKTSEVRRGGALQ